MKKKKKTDLALVLIPVAALLLTLYLLYSVLNLKKVEELPEPEYIGRSVCLDCHEKEFQAFLNSHHDLAMAEATDKNVLGDFDNAIHVYYGDTSWFYKKDDKYFVKTIGEDNLYHDYEIKYTFGWTPLQQYLIEFPDGHYQMLPLCWDTNPEEMGGQRWFHIYPNEKIEPGDELHWTGLNQNWNYMCAECHSTNLQKNYDVSTNTYNTSWNEIDVSCEACHGPGSAHVAWGELEEMGREPPDPNMGLVYLSGEEEVSWIFDTIKGNAYRSKPRTDHTQINMCARCHSRRFVIWDDYVHGQSILQTHRPDILFEYLYYHDGQIKEEDYVYGSFLQSTMYQEGVTCTDCHDAHSYQPLAQGNMVCAKCHIPNMYDAPEHHFHRMDSTGASCLDCHMPETTYMVVDPRRDHSIRIPRPDLSLKINSPNACNQCHTDKSVKWADKHFREWYGNKYDTIPHFGETFHAASLNNPEAKDDLIEIINDSSQTDIVRASALNYLATNFHDNDGLQQAKQALQTDLPLTKTTALQSLVNYSPQSHLPSIYPQFKDSLRTIRIEAMRAIAGVPPQYIAQNQKENVDKQIKEYEKSVMVNADQPGANINLGVMYATYNQYEDAERSYRNAIRIDSGAMAAYVNLADLYRMQGNDEKGEEILLRALQINPELAEIHYSLGLLYARRQQINKALEYLDNAVKLQEENARFKYVYAVALNTAGKTDEAITLLNKAYHLSPNDIEILFALATIYRDAGETVQAQEYTERILELQPDNQQAGALFESLQRLTPHDKP